MELDDDETVALSACDGSLDIQLLELVRLPVCASTCLSVYLPVCLVHFKVVQRKLNSYLYQKFKKSVRNCQEKILDLFEIQLWKTEAGALPCLHVCCISCILFCSCLALSTVKR